MAAIAPQPTDSFRSIQPALAIIDDPAARSSPKRDKQSPIAWSASLDKRAKRFKSVTQACNTCRRHKARCDGARPRCGGCTSKGKPCRYEGEAGQSRQAAIKARLEALEKLVNALQSKPQDEAQRLLQHIRSADDIVALSGHWSDPGSDTTLDGLASGSVSCPSSTSRGSSPQASARDASSPAVLSPSHAVRDTDSLIRLIMPKPEPTRTAIRKFYTSSGGLFYAFPQHQMEEYWRGVFEPGFHINVSQKVAICCLSSVAAVGEQYAACDIDGVDRGSAAYYDIARHYFANIVEDHPLEAIKVCAMLAMYNTMAKSTAGLAYVEAGMSMSQRFASPGSSRPSFLTEPEWDEFRIAWRMLLFLSSWMSSTLGYVSGKDESTFQTVAPEVVLEHDHNTTIGELAQIEMTKISLLKARVLRAHLALKVLDKDSLDSALQALQVWHDGLPPQLLLTTLARTDLAAQDRRTLFYVHFFYLGAIILVYRRIISEAAQAPWMNEQEGQEHVTRRKNPGKDLLGYADSGIFAAKYTARLLGLLLAERGIVKRCWLVIFQAHTSCVVILHSVAQKVLHNIPPSEWLDDLKHAQLCLDTLQFCGTIDPIALSFYEFLAGAYDTLSRTRSRGGSNEQTKIDDSREWVSFPPELLPMDKHSTHDSSSSLPDGYLISTPPGGDRELKELSLSLLSVVCRPWDDPAEARLRSQQQSLDMLRAKEGDPRTAQLLTSNWDYTGSSTFRWDTGAMGFGPGGAAEECCFMGSEEPSGWTPVAEVEVEDSKM